MPPDELEHDSVFLLVEMSVSTVIGLYYAKIPNSEDQVQ